MVYFKLYLLFKSFYSKERNQRREENTDYSPQKNSRNAATEIIFFKKLKL